MAWRDLAMIAVLAMSVLFASNAQEVIPAEKLLAQIESHQPIYYDSVLVSGDLDLQSLPGAIVTNSFALTNSTIINATFDGVTFAKDAVFWGTSFGNASFYKASFLGMADLANTSFQQASFGEASFSGPAVFDEAWFQR